MPRAALLSIHARVDGTEPSTWEDPSLVQLWGPRFSAYVVAARDLAVFSLGRLPDDAKGRRFAQDTADRLQEFLGGRKLTANEAGRGLGVHPNRFRYAAPTGRVLIRWDGARRPTVWTVPPPAVDPVDAQLELARRYLHIFGPATPEAFAKWAGIAPRRGRVRSMRSSDRWRPFEHPLATPGSSPRTNPGFGLPPGTRRPRASSQAATRTSSSREAIASSWSPTPTFVEPSGRPGSGRVPSSSRVRSWGRGDARGAEVTLAPWRRLPQAAREAVETEAQSLPLPDVAGRIRVRWDA